MRPTARSLAFLVLVASCGDRAARPGPADSVPIHALVDSGTATNCPATGMWAMCSVLYRLDRGGLAVHADSLADVHHAPLAITGHRMPIARGHIEIFLYADSNSRRADASKLDPKAFISPDRQPSIMQELTVVTNANLLVLMDVVNEANRERIANALMAGPPQPPRNPAVAR